MQKHVNLADLVKSRLSFLNLLFETDSYSNEYLLANFGFDTAEDSPVYRPASQPRTSLVKFARSPRAQIAQSGSLLLLFSIP